MRIAAIDDRLSLLINDSWYDVESLSSSRWSSDPMSALRDWAEFRTWAQAQLDQTPQITAVEPAQASFTVPVPAPPQIFAIGLNYKPHAAETSMQLPTSPMVFTKFQSSLTGPNDTVTLPSEAVDFEVELVAVIGKEAYRVQRDEAWEYVAALTLGQDLSERDVQMRNTPPQFSLGKSYPGFAPIGPVLVTPDELDDPDAISVECSIEGAEVLQKGNSREMIFDIATLVADLSSVTRLLPGDLIFTGTPEGVGFGRTPRRYLQPGEVLVSHAEGIGSMRNPLVADS